VFFPPVVISVGAGSAVPLGSVQYLNAELKVDPDVVDGFENRYELPTVIPFLSGYRPVSVETMPPEVC
jgi:hypothetical protein